MCNFVVSGVWASVCFLLAAFGYAWIAWVCHRCHSECNLPDWLTERGLAWSCFVGVAVLAAIVWRVKYWLPTVSGEMVLDPMCEPGRVLFLQALLVAGCLGATSGILIGRWKLSQS